MERLPQRSRESFQATFLLSLLLLLGGTMLMPINAQNTTAEYYWPVASPVAGPSWNVPRFSLPSCLGVLSDFVLEWWYFAGHGVDTQGNEYSLFFLMDRTGNPFTHVDTSGFYMALGDVSKKEFLYAATSGSGLTGQESEWANNTVYFPAPTDWSFTMKHKPDSSWPADTGFSFTYNANASKGHPVGGPNAVYNLLASGNVAERNSKPLAKQPPFAFDLQLRDGRGTVMEGLINGDASLALDGRASWEFGLPKLQIAPGSTIVYNGSTITLHEGNLWLDRQTIQPPPGMSPVGSRGVYIGTWLAIHLSNGVIMQAWTLWQAQEKAGQQWISGTMVGRPPTYVGGQVFYPIKKVPQGSQGGAPLWSTADFDLNILSPEKPSSSPHYTSPVSNHTYGLAWQLDINLEKLGNFGKGTPCKLFLFPLMGGSVNTELHMGQFSGKATYFSELAGKVYADKGKKKVIGRAFIEQMGFN